MSRIVREDSDVFYEDDFGNRKLINLNRRVQDYINQTGLGRTPKMNESSDDRRVHTDSERKIGVNAVRKIGGYVGQIIVNGIIVFEDTTAHEERKDALKAVDERVAERMAKVFGD